MSQNQTSVPSSIRLQADLRDRLVSVCDAKRMKPSAGMVEAITVWVKREEQRITLREEAKAAHDLYVATGLHVTEEEANAWMDQLEQGIDAEPPKCHI